MRYKPNWFDLTYDASFRGPLFALAGNPVAVLAALHAKLSSKYSLSANDMVVDSGHKVGDVRARVTLFSGNGTVEIRADGFSAKFVNPVAPGDTDVVKDCVLLTHDALSEIRNGKVSFQEEALSLRMFIELLDVPLDGPLFMRGLSGEAKFFGALDVPTGVEVVPGLQIEFLQDEQKWMFTFVMGRSHRSRKELFIVATTRFYDGTPFQTIDQKVEHVGALMKAAFARAEMEAQPVENK